MGPRAKSLYPRPGFFSRALVANCLSSWVCIQTACQPSALGVRAFLPGLDLRGRWLMSYPVCTLHQPLSAQLVPDPAVSWPTPLSLCLFLLELLCIHRVILVMYSIITSIWQIWKMRSKRWPSSHRRRRRIRIKLKRQQCTTSPQLALVDSRLMEAKIVTSRSRLLGQSHTAAEGLDYSSRSPWGSPRIPFSHFSTLPPTIVLLPLACACGVPWLLEPHLAQRRRAGVSGNLYSPNVALIV